MWEKTGEPWETPGTFYMKICKAMISYFLIIYFTWFGKVKIVKINIKYKGYFNPWPQDRRMTCPHLPWWPYPCFCVCCITHCSLVPFIHFSLCCTQSGWKFGWNRRAFEEAVRRSGFGESQRSDEPELSELVTHSGTDRSFYIRLPAAERSSGYRWRRTTRCGGSSAHRRGRKYYRYRRAFGPLVMFTQLLFQSNEK